MKKNTLIIIILLILSLTLTMFGIMYFPKNINNSNNKQNDTEIQKEEEKVYDGRTYEYDENLVAKDQGPREGREYNEGAYGIGE